MGGSISFKALRLIDQALIPLIKSGCQIDKIKIVVAENADIAEHKAIHTSAGELRVEPSGLVPKGYAYLIEDAMKGFAWVIRKKGKEQPSQDKRSKQRSRNYKVGKGSFIKVTSGT
ncbi:hypothetical protein [Paenibacillus polymyxa]|uniref:hypothetical protein n=1 Tax=Paenibacillus polymyxa TaxID=1406 RepID=UPI00111AAB83|nr:hypothetical protein [Paenibacillus polymyxa]QDA30236.1 hypothetical protein FGY93_25300 [Paenibacillus polymyxa]